jgi:hypothetical protein
MPRRIAMSTLVDRCKKRADKENDDHIETAEWQSLISEVYGADVHSVVSEVGLRYFEYTETLTTTGAAYVSEPDDHLSTVRLDYVDASGIRTELSPIEHHEQTMFSGVTGTARFYAFVDDRIYLYPTPPTGQTYELLYIPQPPDLSEYADDDIIDVVTPDGEACLVWGVAALARNKASQDNQLHFGKQEVHRNRLQAWAADRLITQMSRRGAVDEYPGRNYLEGDYR